MLKRCLGLFSQSFYRLKTQVPALLPGVGVMRSAEFSVLQHPHARLGVQDLIGSLISITHHFLSVLVARVSLLLCFFSDSKSNICSF